MDRPTIADLARAAGVSLSTVDRVINGRDPVRKPTAERVLAAATEIGFHLTGAISRRLGQDRPERTFGFLLQQKSRPFYRILGEALTHASQASPLVNGVARVAYLDDLDPVAISDQIDRLGKASDAVALVVPNHPRIAAAIEALNEKQVPVFAVISELTSNKRIGYVGLDNWKVGRTAAWAIANICKRPGEVGIIVGSHRYRCQDLNEMGFRSYFREHAAEFTLLEARTSLEDARYGAEVTRELLARHPELIGLYVAGGGISGVIAALRDNTAQYRVAVGHDLTPKTREALIDGSLTLVISHPVSSMASVLIEAMAQATIGIGAAPVHVLPFELHTVENI